MRLLNLDSKRRELKVLVETEEDLWDLFNVIEKGDLVYARTTRELKARSGSRRKSMLLGIKVEWVEFQELSKRLRIHGVIFQGPKSLDLEGLRHTISIGSRSEITIFKERGWPDHLLDRILKACKRSSVKALIVCIDYDEVCIALIKEHNVRVIREEDLKLPGKNLPEARSKAIEAILKHLISEILEYAHSLKVNYIVIAGPGPLKDILFTRLRDTCPEKTIYKEASSSGGYAGILEVIRRGLLTRILKDSHIAREVEIMKEFMSLLAQNEELVAYSFEEVRKMLELKAVSKLMIIWELLHSANEYVREQIGDILKKAEDQKAEVIIFSSNTEAYTQLRSLGGIAAILRFKVPKSMRVF